MEGSVTAPKVPPSVASAEVPTTVTSKAVASPIASPEASATVATAEVASPVATPEVPVASEAVASSVPPEAVPSAVSPEPIASAVASEAVSSASEALLAASLEVSASVGLAIAAKMLLSWALVFVGVAVVFNEVAFVARVALLLILTLVLILALLLVALRDVLLVVLGLGSWLALLGLAGWVGWLLLWFLLWLHSGRGLGGGSGSWFLLGLPGDLLLLLLLILLVVVGEFFALALALTLLALGEVEVLVLLGIVVADHTDLSVALDEELGLVVEPEEQGEGDLDLVASQDPHQVLHAALPDEQLGRLNNSQSYGAGLGAQAGVGDRQGVALLQFRLVEFVDLALFQVGSKEHDVEIYN